MNETDFIEKCCMYAKGFLFLDGDISDPVNNWHSPKMLRRDDIIYPLLLQRAIEGVNKRTRYTIEQYCSCVLIRPINVENPFVDGTDLTKEGALRRVFKELEEEK